VLLEVRASNEGARALYRGAGFTEDGLRRRYYSDPEEDAVLMSLNLAEEKNRDPGRLVG
jgi:ribosomal-protein-alanine N-acetyltransferase